MRTINVTISQRTYSSNFQIHTNVTCTFLILIPIKYMLKYQAMLLSPDLLWQSHLLARPYKVVVTWPDTCTGFTCIFLCYINSFHLSSHNRQPWLPVGLYELGLSSVRCHFFFINKRRYFSRKCETMYFFGRLHRMQNFMPRQHRQFHVRQCPGYLKKVTFWTILVDKFDKYLWRHYKSMGKLM